MASVESPEAARPDLRGLLRSPVTVVWAVLIGATLLSWWLGVGHGMSSALATSVVVLVVALVKVRFVGLWFMELRGAPPALRAVFEGYCLAITCVTVGMLVVA